jgi:F-type H+-transporting ATPase subunit b
MLVLLAAEESAIKIDLDPTWLVVCACFVVFTLVLKPLLFDPMLELFARREGLIDGTKAEARKIDEKSASALATYEKQVAEARAKAQLEREKLRAEGVKREQDILAKARAASNEALENGKRAIHDQAERARAALRADAPRTAADLAARVLGRGIQS